MENEKDISNFLTTLNEKMKYFQGNTDCAEPIFDAIVHGLKISIEGTVMFVLTDAPSKNIQSYNSIIELAHAKHIEANNSILFKSNKIVFIFIFFIDSFCIVS